MTNLNKIGKDSKELSLSESFMLKLILFEENCYLNEFLIAMDRKESKEGKEPE